MQSIKSLNNDNINSNEYEQYFTNNTNYTSVTNNNELKKS